MCLEALRGQGDAAKSHIENGLHIFGETQKKNESLGSSLTTDTDVPDYLSAGFGRVSLLLLPIKDHDDEKVASKGFSIAPEIFADEPLTYRFVTLEDARAALSPLLSKGARIVVASKQCMWRLRPDPAVTARVHLEAKFR